MTPPVRLRRPLRPVHLVLVVLSLVSAALVWAAVDLVLARGDLQDARDGLTALRDGPPPDLADASAALDDATDDLRSATARLDQLGPRLVAGLPVLGQVVDGPADLARAGLAVSTSAQDVVQALDGGEGLLVGGRLQLDRLARVRTALERAAQTTREPVAQLLALRPGPLSPLRGGITDGQQALARAPDAFTTAASALSALDGVLGGAGERSVAVVLVNNAEQRGGGGVVSVFAQGTARDGRLELEAFQDVFDVADPPRTARRVPSAEDFHALWGPYLADTTLWRNVSMSPDGPSGLSVVAGVVAATTDVRPDVVLSLDVRAIAAVLEATGPSRLDDGSELSAANAVEQLLLRAYTRFPDDDRGQGERRRVLRGAADAVLTALLDADVDAVPLVRSLARATAGRHVAVWSARPAEQAALVAGGLAGAVRADGGDLAQASTQNFGQSTDEGNKLDYFVRRLHEVDVVVGRRSAQVVQTFSLRNTAPSGGLPGYVLGYSRPGELAALATFAVPADAVVASFSRDGTGLRRDLRRQTDHEVLTDVVQVPPGQTVTWQVRYAVPVVDGRYQLTVLPQALAVDAGLSVTLRPGVGTVLRPGPGSGLRSGPDGGLVLTGSFDRARELVALAEEPGRLERWRDAVRRFWSEPVSLP